MSSHSGHRTRKLLLLSSHLGNLPGQLPNKVGGGGGWGAKDLVAANFGSRQGSAQGSSRVRLASSLSQPLQGLLQRQECQSKTEGQGLEGPDGCLGVAVGDGRKLGGRHVGLAQEQLVLCGQAQLAFGLDEGPVTGPQGMYYATSSGLIWEGILQPKCCMASPMASDLPIRRIHSLWEGAGTEGNNP